MSQAPESIDRLSSPRTHPKLPAVKNLRKLTLLVSIISLSNFFCGYTMSYIVALGYNNLKFVYGDAAVVNVTAAFLFAIVHFGISFGTMITPWVLTLGSRRYLYELSRNLALTLSIIAGGLFGIIQIQNLVVFFIVRAFQGIIVGILMVLISLYIKEITPREIAIKTPYGAFQKSFLLFGIVVPLGITIIMIKNDLDQLIRWRIIVTASALPILIFIIAILTNFIPQSPTSLITKNEEEKAKEVFGLFYRQQQVDRVYNDRIKQLEMIENMNKHIGYPAKHVCKLRAFLTFEIPFIHQFTGVNAYLSQIGFVMGVYNPGFAAYIPFILTLTQLLTMIISSLYMTRVTTRTIILVGNIGMGLCSLAIGTCLIVIDIYGNALWIMTAFAIVFIALNGGTFIPAVGIYVSEVGTKTLVRWSLVLNWFAAAVTIVIFIIVGDKVGFAAIFMGFGTIAVLGFIFNLFLMIQTQQKVLSKSIQLRATATTQPQLNE